MQNSDGKSRRKMKLTHLLLSCLNCTEELEVFTNDIEEGQVDCPYCGYSNELDDIRVVTWEEEW